MFRIPFKLPPTRFFVGATLFLVTFTSYNLRCNLSVIIKGMVELKTDDNSTIVPDYGHRFSFNTYEETMLLGAYFYGTVITQFPSGILTDVLGSRNIIGAAILLASIATACTPLVALVSQRFSFWILFSIRAITGAICGFIYPGQSGLIAKWSPPNETGKFMFTQIAGSFSTVILWPLDVLCMEYFGWASTFYFSAMICVLTTILWYIIIYDSPEKHPRIKESELKFIEDSLKDSVTNKKKSFPPIWKILTSRPFIALMFLNFGNMWAFFFFLTFAPKYLNEVLKYNLLEAGFLASLPYLCRFICGFLFSAIGDALTKHNVCRVVTIRKFFCIFSHIIPGILLYSISFADGNPLHCVAIITMALASNGAMVITNLQNPIDLAPNYTSTIFSLLNGTGISSGIIAPKVVAYFIQENNTAEQWNKVFQIGSIIYIITAIVFMLFGSADIQDWNNISEKSSEDKNHTNTPTESI